MARRRVDPGQLGLFGGAPEPKLPPPTVVKVPLQGEVLGEVVNMICNRDHTELGQPGRKRSAVEAERIVAGRTIQVSGVQLVRGCCCAHCLARQGAVAVTRELGDFVRYHWAGDDRILACDVCRETFTAEALAT